MVYFGTLYCFIAFWNKNQHLQQFRNGMKWFENSVMHCFRSIEMVILLPKRYGLVIFFHLKVVQHTGRNKSKMGVVE